MTQNSFNRDHEIPLRLAPDQMAYLKSPVRNLWGPAALGSAALIVAASIVAFDEEIKGGVIAVKDYFTGAAEDAQAAAPELLTFEPPAFVSANVSSGPSVTVNCDINGGPTTLTLADPQAGDYPTFIAKQMSGCLEGVRQGIDANKATLQGLPQGSAVHFNIGE